MSGGTLFFLILSVACFALSVATWARRNRNDGPAFMFWFWGGAICAFCAGAFL